MTASFASSKLDVLLGAGILRDVDVQLAKTLRRTHDAALSDDAQTVLALASRASGDGHVCLDLSAPDWSFASGNSDFGDRSALLADLSPAQALNIAAACAAVVGDGSGDHPFVLSGHRLYLRRFWNYERRVALQLRSLAAEPAGELTPGDETAIAQTQLASEQQTAVRMALSRRLTLVTGGPGTGKTTVAAHVLRILANRPGLARPLRVRTAAPTGKAAARIDESLDAVLGSEIVARERACTVERLLGYRKGSPYFRHDRANPLPADIVLVDETSMIDLPKMAKLLDAIGQGTRLILLGDKDQLASVEPGSVMAELCQSAALAPCVATLSESHRFKPGSPVARLSHAVNGGHADSAWAIAQNSRPDIAVHSSAGFRAAQPPPEFVRAIRDGYRDFLAAPSPDAAFRALAKFRVLCALRQGPQGVDAVNRAIEDILLPQRQGEFYDHRVVLVAQNDYDLNLFNGDVGVVLPDPAKNNQLAVFFDNRQRPVPCSRLPAHETAFSMTVHKAQGSGFGRVLVLLPEKDSPVLAREMIYTAITRTQTGVDLWCAEYAFKTGVARCTRRTMGLRQRLDD